DVVAGIVDARQLLVEVLDVPAQPPAGRAAEQFERFELLGAHAVVVDRDLRRRARIEAVRFEIDRLEQLEDVGAAALDGRVAGAVRTDDEALRHGPRQAARSSRPFCTLASTFHTVGSAGASAGM